MSNQYKVEAVDLSGNVITGYAEILQGDSPQEVLEDWRHHHIYTADCRMCGQCGENMWWTEGEYICSHCDHRNFFDGYVEKIT